MRFLRFLLGFVAGAAAGVALGALLTPQSGADNQSYLRKKIDEIKAEGERAAQERRAEMEVQLAQMRAPRPAGMPSEPLAS